MLVAGTVTCVLCHSLVTYRAQDEAKFARHMRLEHAAHFNIQLALAMCLMDADDQETVKNIIFEKRQQAEELQEETDSDTVPVDSEDEEDLVSLAEQGERETSQKNDIFSAEKRCDICKRDFTTISTRKHHMRRLHPDVDIDEHLFKADLVKKEFKADNEVDVKTSSYFNHCTSAITSVKPGTASEYTEDDARLPGWRIKYIPKYIPNGTYTNGIRKMKRFLTPRKKHCITSGLGVLEYLRLQGMSPADLKSLADHLSVNKLPRLFNNYYETVNKDKDPLS